MFLLLRDIHTSYPLPTYVPTICIIMFDFNQNHIHSVPMSRRIHLQNPQRPVPDHVLPPLSPPAHPRPYSPESRLLHEVLRRLPGATSGTLVYDRGLRGKVPERQNVLCRASHDADSSAACLSVPVSADLSHSEDGPYMFRGAVWQRTLYGR